MRDTNWKKPRPILHRPNSSTAPPASSLWGETAKLFYQYQYETGQKLPHRLLEPTTWAMIVQGRQISAGEMAWARDVMLAQETCRQSIFLRATTC